MTGGVAEPVRRVGWDVDGFASSDDCLLPAEGGVNLAVKDGEGFFKVLAVWGRPAAGRNVHVDEAVAPRSVFAGDEDGVGVADEAEVWGVGGLGVDLGQAAG